MRKTFILGILCQLFLVPIQAQYYNPALGKNGAQLKTALHNIIKNHIVGTYADLWTSFYSTDNKSGNEVWDIYSDKPGSTPPYVYTLGASECGTYNQEGDCYNREHTWPSSYFGGNTPMYTDIQQIFPTDGWVNNKRGNLPYGVVKSGGTAWTSNNGSKTGSSNTYAGYSGDVFEPIDSFKGDLARVYFYMSTRYEGEDGGWSNWEMANGAILKPDAIALLLSWHHSDPVSQKEIDRNNAIQGIQNNRNPFIDYPVFADCIWGTGDCTSLHVSDVLNSSVVNLFPNPCNNQLHVSLGINLKVDSYIIYDFLGRRILSTSLQGDEITLPNMNPGNYLLELHTKQGVARKIFTKK